MEIIWKNTYGYINKIHLFTIVYDGCKNYTEKNPNMHKLICLLPGIKTHIGHYQNSEKAENEAKLVWKYWVNKMNLKEK